MKSPHHFEVPKIKQNEAGFSPRRITYPQVADEYHKALNKTLVDILKQQHEDYKFLNGIK
jgi:hypothetical protein